MNGPDSFVNRQSTQQERVTFTLAFNWKLSVVGLLMLPLLLRLGFWQLERAQEKQQLSHAIEQQRQQPAVDNISLLQNFSQGSQLQRFDLQYRKVRLTGRFDQTRYWLLDNKTRQGKAGYEIIAPFTDTTGKTLLVNRGWVAAPRLRNEIPAVDTVPGTTTIDAYVYQPSSNLYTASMLSENPLKNSAWPQRIQKIDIAEIYQQLNLQPTFPFVLRLADFSDGALVTQWRWMNSSADKHQGYAVQWFAMAVVLLVALLFANSNFAQVIRQRLQ